MLKHGEQILRLEVNTVDLEKKANTILQVFENANFLEDVMKTLMGMAIQDSIKNTEICNYRRQQFVSKVQSLTAVYKKYENPAKIAEVQQMSLQELGGFNDGQKVMYYISNGGVSKTPKEEILEDLFNFITTIFDSFAEPFAQHSAQKTNDQNEKKCLGCSTF